MSVDDDRGDVEVFTATAAGRAAAVGSVGVLIALVAVTFDMCGEKKNAFDDADDGEKAPTVEGRL